MAMSRIEALMAERTGERLAVASARAIAALDALEKAGSAKILGILAV